MANLDLVIFLFVLFHCNVIIPPPLLWSWHTLNVIIMHTIITIEYASTKFYNQNICLLIFHVVDASAVNFLMKSVFVL